VFEGEQAADRPPVIVYLYDGAMDVEKMEKGENRMFGDDDLAMVSRFFRMVRVDADNIDDERMRAEYAKRLPAFYALAPDGEVLARKAGRVSARSLTAFLGKAYRNVYRKSVRPRIKALERFLDELEDAEVEVAKVREEIDRIEQRLARGRKPRLLRDLADTRKELAQAEQALAALEQKKKTIVAPPTSGAAGDN